MMNLDSQMEKIISQNKYNHENGWGDYDGFVTFVSNCIKEAIDHPYSEIEVSI